MGERNPGRRRRAGAELRSEAGRAGICAVAAAVAGALLLGKRAVHRPGTRRAATIARRPLTRRWRLGSGVG